MEQVAQTVIDFWGSGAPNYVRMQSLIFQFAESHHDIKPLTEAVKNIMGWQYPATPSRR